MKFDIIIQARFGSKRLPGKIFLNFDNKKIIDYLLNNLKTLKNSKKINKIILITPKDEFENEFSSICKKHKLTHFAPKIDEKNLLKRYFLCAKKFNSKNIIRVTSDCPFINPHMIKKMIEFYQSNKLNFLTNNKPRFIPHGFDCEIISMDYLKETYKKAKTSFDKEHITQWIYRNKFTKKRNYIKLFKYNLSSLRLTIDRAEDYLFFIKNRERLKIISKSIYYEKYCLNLKKKIIRN